MQKVIRAYKQENIEMAYQPIKELKSGKTLGYEALLRIQDKKPEEFIAKAYKQGMLLDLEKQICKKIAQEFSSTQDDTVVFINLTPYSFAYQKGHAIMQSLAGLDPTKVVIELTEQTVVPQDISDAGKHWRQKGYRLAVDDISQGFSRLSLVAMLNPNFIKIDKSCISGALTSNSWKQVLSGIVSMAKNMGSKTIGEGVETEEEKELLIEFDIDYGQGYYFGKPG